MSDRNETRRGFMSYFAGIGLGSTLAPGVVWARMQDVGTQTITMGMILALAKAFQDAATFHLARPTRLDS
jgi:hypothetical protein